MEKKEHFLNSSHYPNWDSIEIKIRQENSEAVKQFDEYLSP
jgi:hypothetical protein